MGRYNIPSPEVFALNARPKEKVIGTNVFSKVAGSVMLINAVVFAFFIYNPSLYIFKYIQNIGIITFINFNLIENFNYTYGTGFIDMILVAATVLSGLALMTRFSKSHIITSLVSGAMLVMVSFEYLSSTANYLIAVCMLTFIGIGALAYSRMSAVSVEEEFAKSDVNWPRIETF